MKIIFDTGKNTVKVGSKTFGVDMAKEKENCILSFFRKFVKDHTMISDFNGYEEDCMWMSYRYCIGRHTIASQMHANNIWNNCRGRMSSEMELFTAYDINREIERVMQFSAGPNWYFPCTSLNRIYTSAIDIFCEFIDDYKINSKEDYLKYYSIKVILADNERGYKIETTTWEEKLRPEVMAICRDFSKNNSMSEDEAWTIFTNIMNATNTSKHYDGLKQKFNEITKDMPDPNYFYFHDIEDLFVWNDLVHCFDHEHHHKSTLTDGSECEWFWSWREKTEEGEDGYLHRVFGYERIRVPIDKWNGSTITYIPDEYIVTTEY